MLPLKHQGNTIIVWNLAGPTQSEVLEPKTGTTEERIEAARKCQEAGYTVRYKFKPIIPVRGWREDAARTVEMALTRTNPDVISLCCFMWMDCAEMVRRLGRDRIDPEFLAAAEASAEEMGTTVTRPFPEAMRAKIYDFYLKEIRKWNREVPVSLSTESWEMWERFRKRLGASGSNYVCGCGPQSTPRLRKLPRGAWRDVVRNDGSEGHWRAHLRPSAALADAGIRLGRMDGEDQIGPHGLMVTRVGFGALPLQRGSREAAQILCRAYDAGINFYDTARVIPIAKRRLAMR